MPDLKYSVSGHVFSLMKQTTYRSLFVRSLPGLHSHGLLRAGHLTVPVTLGRSGLRADKREGDGATPKGRFRLRRLWWRADRMNRPKTLLPVRRIGADDGWCEVPTDRRYNHPVKWSPSETADRLWRDDHLYDLIIELDHNTRPRIAGRGSAVFIHIARPDRGPTAGCVALQDHTLRRLLPLLSPKTRIVIQ
jgi:L,D-peptidoglycan transpeptidase YkuD (ErfK/YbiS/YcfS/YnhG family)